MMNRIYLFFIVGIFVITSCQKTPEASFETTFEDGVAEIYDVLKFKNTSADGSSYEWDLGDGTTSTEMNVDHQYSKAGKYTVKLIAFSENGKKSNEYSEVIGVHQRKLVSLNLNMNQFRDGNTGNCWDDCSKIEARIYVWPEKSATPIYISPIDSMNAENDSVFITLDKDIIFTDDNWRWIVTDVDPTGEDTIAVMSMNPTGTWNGLHYTTGLQEHWIGANNVALSILFDFTTD